MIDTKSGNRPGHKRSSTVRCGRWEMKVLCKGFVGALLGIVLLHEIVPAPAETPAPTSLQAKRQAQERARTMARELVTGVLDMQLTKLEVNGLDKLPIYGEIASMRKNIDRV